MPRDLPISNGNLMINFDHEYNIRDVYYPHVGQDNQTVGDVSFFGVWCDGKFAWIGNPAWIKTMDYDGDSLVTRVVARSPSFDLEMNESHRCNLSSRAARCPGPRDEGRLERTRGRAGRSEV